MMVKGEKVDKTIAMAKDSDEKLNFVEKELFSREL